MGAFDDIIAKYGNPEGNANPQPTAPPAQARFSRAPIFFHDMAALAREAGLLPETIRELDPSGAYRPRANFITLSVTPKASLGWMQSIARHEDAHAVIDQAGIPRTSLPPSLHDIPARSFLDTLISIPAPPTVDLSWMASHRAGNFDTEIPAYMTAYRPGELKGITPDMAQRWVNAYSKTLPADAKSKILRLGEISRGVLSK